MAFNNIGGLLQLCHIYFCTSNILQEAWPIKVCWKGWMDNRQTLWKDTANFHTEGSWPFFFAGGNSLAIQLPPEKVTLASLLLGSHGNRQHRISVIKIFMRWFACKFNEIQHLWNSKASDISERQSNGCYLLSYNLGCPSSILVLCKLKKQSVWMRCPLLVWSVNIRTIWLNSISASPVILELKPLSSVSHNTFYANHLLIIQTRDLFQEKKKCFNILFLLSKTQNYIYNWLFFLFTLVTRKISCLKSFALSEALSWVVKVI